MIDILTHIIAVGVIAGFTMGSLTALFLSMKRWVMNEIERRCNAAIRVMIAQSAYHDVAPRPTVTHSANESSPDVHQPYLLDAIRDGEQWTRR